MLIFRKCKFFTINILFQKSICIKKYFLKKPSIDSESIWQPTLSIDRKLSTLQYWQIKLSTGQYFSSGKKINYLSFFKDKNLLEKFFFFVEISLNLLSKKMKMLSHAIQLNST